MANIPPETKYSSAHRQMRRQLLPHAYGTPCHLCRRLMLPGQALDLDHTIDGTDYRGMTHRSCNRADGGRRGAAVTNARRSSRRRDPGPSQDW